MSLPLEGIRVLDLSRMLPGPFCTQILADYGAEVIKIEDKGGEKGRRSHPLLGNQGARFFAVNRNKKSITLDLRKNEGKAIFRKLVANSDVIVDGFRPGVMDKLGLPYEELKQVNDRIIYCAINAFGSNGPLSQVPAHDINILSLAGIAALNGARDGKLVLPPIQLAGNAAGSLYAVIAILTALTNLQKTGLGQFCDVSMMDGAVSLLAYTLAEWSANEVVTQRGQGLLTGGFAYFNIYETSDHKYVSLGASEAKFWQEFCQRIGKPEYISIQWKSEMQEEMIAGIGAIIKEKSQAEWTEIFVDTNICFTPVLELDEMCEHPQVLARDMIIKMSDFRDSGKDMILSGLPIKFSDTPGEVKLTFPEAGEHTAEILSAAGYTSEEIHLFKINGVV